MTIEQFRPCHTLAVSLKWVTPILLIPAVIIAYYTEASQDTAVMAILGLVLMFLTNIAHAWTSWIMRQYGRK